MVSIILSGSENLSSLRHTLASLRAQTARSSISEVIISEAIDAEEVKSLAAEYPELPIAPREAEASTEGLDAKRIHGLQTPFVAFLQDNAWWSVDCLEASLATLQSLADCSAVYGNFYETEGPPYPARSGRAAWRVWISSGCDFTPFVVRLDQTATTLATLLGPNLHLSTLLARTEVLQAASRQLPSREEGYECDRILPLLLAKFGPIAYITKPKAFIRILLDEASLANHGAKTNDPRSATTRWILKQEPSRVHEAARRFNRLAEALPRVGSAHAAFPALPTIVHGITGPQWSALAFECGLNLMPRDQVVKDGNWFLRQICPPALLSLMRRREPQLHPYAIAREVNAAALDNR